MTSQSPSLRDFTVDSRVLLLSLVALGIGGCGAVLAVLLLRCIGLATNLFYYHRFDFALVSPAATPLGNWAVVVPVIGGLLIGLMARYGSEKIRGHGIPEAIEAILLRGARVEPRLAILKPLSAAISIGSGGPFGAEGPIIMTGGAFGSLIAQVIHLSDAERTTLLVAGAAAGMSATFATPLAAVLLAVELLLFELRPRSLAPVAIASVTAAVVRVLWLGHGPLFAIPFSFSTENPTCSFAAIALGIFVGWVSSLVSRMVYGFEDFFPHLHVPAMWWPAIGGIGIGIGGLFFPRALGVGYDNIAALLSGQPTIALIIGVLIVKTLIWSFSLGSGTSGGVLAPLLMIGGALGAGAAQLLGADPSGRALWALVGMGAMLSGSLGVPLTAIVFSLELTHSFSALLPLVLACVASHTLTSLIMPRSILTERLSRRGYHLTREYGVDPLETTSVRDVMSQTTAGFESPATYVLVDDTCRTAAELMATSGSVSLPVCDPVSHAVIGTVALKDLLLGRRRAFGREQDRSRIFTSLGTPRLPTPLSVPK